MNTSTLALQKALLGIGFSDKEASVYLALLELGQAPVSKIARKAKINRTTGYVILGNLSNKGLVSISGKEPKEEYMTESPEKIKIFLEKELNQKEKALQSAHNLIPTLESLHNIKKRSQVRFYEGRDGLKQVYEDTLTSHEPIRAYASVEDTQGTLSNYFPTYYKRRAAKNIPIRALFPDTPAARERIKHNLEEKRQSLLVPSETFSFTPEINIYDNKIMIASWKEKLGIIIESQEISDAMKKIFELAWVGAKHLGSHKEKIEI